MSLGSATVAVAAVVVVMVVVARAFVLVLRAQAKAGAAVRFVHVVAMIVAFGVVGKVLGKVVEGL